MSKSMPVETKEYLGDGVYANLWTSGVVLTTEDGVAVGNRIYLEDFVLDALEDFMKRKGVGRHANNS